METESVVVVRMREEEKGQGIWLLAQLAAAANSDNAAATGSTAPSTQS
jgi:hypothetical protein